MGNRRFDYYFNHILISIFQVAILGCGIIACSAIEVIDVDRNDLEMIQDDKPSLYEYFGGSNPAVSFKFIMTSNIL